jgi:hypothetical protein
MYQNAKFAFISLDPFYEKARRLAQRMKFQDRDLSAACGASADRAFLRQGDRRVRRNLMVAEISRKTKPFPTAIYLP